MVVMQRWDTLVQWQMTLREIGGGDGGDAEMGHNGALRLHLQHMFRDKIKNNSSSITNPKTIV